MVFLKGMKDRVSGVKHWRRKAFLAACAVVLTVAPVHAQVNPPAQPSQAKQSSSTHSRSHHRKKTTRKAAKPGATTASSHGTGKRTASSTRTMASSRHGTRRASRKSASWRTRGQQKPDSERATQIQTALIREHYMTGEPTGAWDAATQQAMQRYQADNGWQTKTTPDARALIKLGLGPDQNHLLNPDTAATSAPVIKSVSTPAPAHDPSPAAPTGSSSNSQK